MQTILIIGAGKSSGALIEYLSNHAMTDNFRLAVADINDDTLARIRSAYGNVDVIPIKTFRRRGPNPRHPQQHSGNFYAACSECTSILQRSVYPKKNTSSHLPIFHPICRLYIAR
ncbi:MAG: hypothetical protein RMJ53_06080 [Chitinophagales bacterium]|nr:hypothetical protein [Chitinophagales bacterium]